MNKVDENNLRDFGDNTNILESLKNIKPSKEVHNNIWNNIEDTINSERRVDKNLFMSFKPYLAIAAIIFISFVAFFFFNENKVVSTPKNIVKIKIGGTIIPTSKTNFKILKENNKEGAVFLSNGELDVYVIPSKKGEIKKRFEVKTNDGLVIVKGTKFKVTTDESGTTVFVKKGKVWVEPIGKGRDKIILTQGLSTHILPLNTFLKKSKEEGTKAYINKDYLNAKKSLESYLLNKKNDYGVITILARIAEAEKRYENAISLYNQVLKGATGIEQETALIAIAILLKKNNEVAKSRKMFLEYLDKFPEGVFRSDVYKQLNEK
jgi:hypothetical protein